MSVKIVDMKVKNENLLCAKLDRCKNQLLKSDGSILFPFDFTSKA